MKLFEFHWSFTKESSWQEAIIGSDNVVMLDRCQAIIWSNDGLVYRPAHVLLGLNELTF